MGVTLRARRSIWYSWRVTVVAPRIVNAVSYLMRINHEIHFAWQAQYLAKLECHFSWQAQHFVKFWEIAGVRNVVFFPYKMYLQDAKSKVSEAAGARWRFYVRNMLESCFFWRKQFRDFPLTSRRSIWCCSTVTRNAPRIVNNVSYVRSYYHESDFACQAQYLVQLEGDSCCSARIVNDVSDADQSWDSFCVVGAVFGKVGVSLFVAGAAFREILGDSRSAKCCIRSGGYEMTILCSDYALSFGGNNSGIFRWHLEVGIRSIWCCSTVRSNVPRIINDILYVRNHYHENAFAWQAQYLVKLACDSCCSAQCN